MLLLVSKSFFSLKASALSHLQIGVVKGMSRGHLAAIARRYCHNYTLFFTLSHSGSGVARKCAACKSHQVREIVQDKQFEFVIRFFYGCFVGSDWMYAINVIFYDTLIRHFASSNELKSR